MKGVNQDCEGWPRGSCVQAAYASLLGLPLSAVPRFDPASLQPGEHQGDREREWLASIGFSLVEISTEPDSTLPQDVLDCMPQVPHLMSGISPRGFGHRVVGIGGKIAFDPHPSRAGLVTVYSVGILVPYDSE